jgi:hypothetical protein
MYVNVRILWITSMICNIILIVFLFKIFQLKSVKMDEKEHKANQGNRVLSKFIQNDILVYLDKSLWKLSTFIYMGIKVNTLVQDGKTLHKISILVSHCNCIRIKTALLPNDICWGSQNTVEYLANLFSAEDKSYSSRTFAFWWPPFSYGKGKHIPI